MFDFEKLKDNNAIFWIFKWPEMRRIAADCGWALGLHGSAVNDLDVMAMPWTIEHTSADELARRIAERDDDQHREFIKSKPGDKPNDNCFNVMTNPSDYIDMKKLLESLLKKTRHSVIKRSDLLDALKEQNFEFIDGSLLKVAQKEKETQAPEPVRYIEHLREGAFVPGIIFIDNKCPIKVNFVVEKVLPQPHPDLLYTTFYCRITAAFDLSSSTSSTIVYDTYYSFEVRASDTLHTYVKAKDALLFVSSIERDAEYNSEYRVFLTKKAAQNAISQWQKNGDFVTSPPKFSKL